MTSDAETVLLFSVGSLSICRRQADAIREYVAPRVGIPAEKIFFTATHCHNAPTNYLISDAAKKYRALYLQWLAQKLVDMLEEVK